MIRSWFRKARANEGPIETFIRSLPTADKPRARFIPSTGKWNMDDGEKIRVAKLYAKAGYPGMYERTYD